MSIYNPCNDSYLMVQSLEKEIPTLLKRNKNLTFLEIGCGSGINLETAFKLGIKKENIFSCDIDKDSINHCLKLGFNCVYSNLF